MLELLNQLDGFDFRGEVKVSLTCDAPLPILLPVEVSSMLSPSFSFSTFGCDVCSAAHWTLCIVGSTMIGYCCEVPFAISVMKQTGISC